MEMEKPPGNSPSPTIFSRLRILKNLIVISLSFVLIFTAYNGLSMLQSTMNQDNGIGTVSQAVIYVSFGISSLLFPDYTIKKLGCKTTLFLAMIMYLPYVAANFCPLWVTMIPSGLLLGFGASILWGAQCTYFNESSFLFCTLDDDDIEEPSDGIPPSTNTIIDKLSSTTSYDRSSLRKKGEELNPRNLNLPPIDEIPENDISESSAHKSTNKLLDTNENISEPFVTTPKMLVKQYGSSEKALIQNRNTTLTSEIENNSKNNSIRAEIIPPQTSRDSITSAAIEFYSLFDSTTACFFGCHGLAYYSAQIWSNLMSFYILHPHSKHNKTRIFSCSCGADFCNDESYCINDDSGKITTQARYTLTGVCLALGVLGALLILVFLDSLERHQKNREPMKFSLDHFAATFNICRKKEQFVLVPLTMYVGMAQGFYTADMTKSYIDCAWGTSHVGLVTVFYGLACALSSTISGCLVQFTGRIPIFLVGQFVNIINYGFLLVWSPERHHPFMFYLAASLWGIITGLFWSQLQAFYGVLFQRNEEAAFGSYYLYSAMGWTLSFAYSDYICTWIKIYILTGVSCVGITGYLYCERIFRLKQQQSDSTNAIVKTT